MTYIANEIVQTDAELEEREAWVEALMSSEDDEMFPDWGFWTELADDARMGN